jgi:hypothetical protein
MHHDVADAYDAAQDRAVVQIIGWLAAHATTRVGPRGGQVQVPVEMLEAVTVQHYTSRAGDPHRHLHLQIGARVFATEQWRGLHTVGVRDFLAAINGIGHAAVACDPQFRAALAAHGYTLDATGEIPDRGAPRRTARSGAAAGLGHPRLGRGAPGQGHPPLRGRPSWHGGEPSWGHWAIAIPPTPSRWRRLRSARSTARLPSTPC